MAFETINGDNADTHGQIVTLLKETGYPHLVSIPLIVSFFRQMTISPSMV